MRIGYIIYVTEPGRGGHYYSLRSTVREVQKEADVFILSIGAKPSPIYNEFGEQYIHINDVGLFKTLKKISTLIKSENLDVIHAFDPKAFLFARLVSIKHSVPLLLTRCGGPNPKPYYPLHSNIVLYSLENLEYFQNKKKFKDSELTFIPNRIDSSQLIVDHERVKKLQEVLNTNSYICLRISRIGKTYEKSILQGIKLVQRLAENNVSIKFVCIGVVEDESVYKRLRNNASEDVFFFTEEYYHLNASQLIDVADLVIGTGRSFMEAALLNKKMIIPTSNTTLPELIDDKNYLDAFYVNFSQRYESSKTDDVILREYLDAFASNKKIEKGLSSRYKKDFSAEYIYQKHFLLYKKAVPAKIRPVDILLNYLQHTGIRSWLIKQKKWIFSFLNYVRINKIS